MKNTKILIIALILILGTLAIPSSLTNRVHATGSPTVFISPSVRPLAPRNSLVAFNVSVSNIPASTTLGGWDIIVAVSDSSVLRPISINLVETFGGTSIVLSNCINGVGTGCTVGDGNGTAHSAVTSFSGPYPSGNLTLFTVKYNSTTLTGYTFLTLPSPLVIDPTGIEIKVAAGSATYGNAANAPVAVFSWSPALPYVGDFVTLNASLSYDPGGGRIVNYLWSCFPTCGNSPIVTVQFLSPKNFTVSLSVIDDKGLRSSPTYHEIEVRKSVTPVAHFTFTPSKPSVGQTVNFDGSSSFDPNGTIIAWNWRFDDGFFNSGEFTSHAYSAPGNYSVTLTVQDNAGLFSFINMTVPVQPKPLHDVSIIQVFTSATRAVSTQTVPIEVELVNDGRSNETVSVTAFANGVPVQTLHGIFLEACPIFNNFCHFVNYETILWDTSGTAPGNYTISATVFLSTGEVDPTIADNSLTDGIVTILPAPVVAANPSMGVIGTRITVQGSGFVSPSEVYVEFDNMSIGFTYTHDGTFTFIFNIPLSQPGVHRINVFDPYSRVHAAANITVQPAPTGNLVVSVDVGTIYFPGDTAIVYVQTTFNGLAVGPQNVQLKVVLIRPDGTNVTLGVQSIGTGIYKATYSLSRTATIGTYVVVAKAHETGPFDASAVVTFEIKLPWLSTGSGRLAMTAASIAGVVGLVGLAWKKAYLQRRKDEEASESPRKS